MGCVIGLYKTVADFEYATAGWVYRYNNRRLHSTLGMMAHVEFERPATPPLSNREPPRA